MREYAVDPLTRMISDGNAIKATLTDKGRTNVRPRFT